MRRVGRITPDQVARAMELDEASAWRIARRLERYYLPERKKLVGRKERVLDVPKDFLKSKLTKLHRWVQRENLFHPCAHGGIKRRSSFTSAGQHLGRVFAWTRDVTDCYPSITPNAVFKQLRKLGFRCDTARLLTMLGTVRGRVPQGSPLSGDIQNLFFRELDQFAASESGKYGMGYSRNADDIIISGDIQSDGDRLISLIEDKLSDLGLHINEVKKAKNGFQPVWNRIQTVHNIAVSRSSGTRISTEYSKKATLAAGSYVRACKSVQPSSLEAVARRRKSLIGHVSQSGQAKFSCVRHLRLCVRIGDDIIAEKLRSNAIATYRGKWWVMSKKRNEPVRLAMLWEKRLACDAAKKRVSAAGDCSAVVNNIRVSSAAASFVTTG